eukprot:s3935_g5.t1
MAFVVRFHVGTRQAWPTLLRQRVPRPAAVLLQSSRPRHFATPAAEQPAESPAVASVAQPRRWDFVKNQPIFDKYVEFKFSEEDRSRCRAERLQFRDDPRLSPPAALPDTAELDWSETIQFQDLIQQRLEDKELMAKFGLALLEGKTSWEQKGWEEPAPSFPSYNQQGWKERSRQLGKQQAFQEKMKVAWMKEQRNYLKNSERQDQEIEAATQQQAAARALVCQAWKGQDQGHPAVTAEQARESEWNEMITSWEGEAEAGMDGVLRRALEQTATTPGRRTAPPMTPPIRSSAPAPRTEVVLSPGPTLNDPYQMADVGGGPPAVLSPTALGLPSTGGEEPMLGASSPRQSPKQPRKDVKTTTKTPVQTAVVRGPDLAEKLEKARRSALLPFGGPGILRDNASGVTETEAAPRVSFVEDDPDELQSASPGFGALDT